MNLNCNYFSHSLSYLFHSVFVFAGHTLSLSRVYKMQSVLESVHAADASQSVARWELNYCYCYCCDCNCELTASRACSTKRVSVYAAAELSLELNISRGLHWHLHAAASQRASNWFCCDAETQFVPSNCNFSLAHGANAFANNDRLYNNCFPAIPSNMRLEHAVYQTDKCFACQTQLCKITTT
jgi:hypothetical protein